MGENKYDVVMFPLTGALAVCDLDIDSGKVYAFSVKRKLMRMFDVSTWNSAVKLADERASYAIDKYLEWSRTEGVRDDRYRERINNKDCLIEKRRKAVIHRQEAIKYGFGEKGVVCLWHITHRDNIKSILKYGILNHRDAHRLRVNRVDISDHDAQRWREKIEPHYNRKIHDYAPLYIKPRNPMLYVRRHLQSELCLVEVSLSVMFENEYLIADGNAASRSTKFFNSVDHINALPWDVLNGGFWPDYEDGKRKMCTEVLVYPEVTPNHIGAIHCYSRNTLNAIADCDCNARISRNLFF